MEAFVPTFKRLGKKLWHWMLALYPELQVDLGRPNKHQPYKY
jgi:hypothetical protein